MVLFGTSLFPKPDAAMSSTDVVRTTALGILGHRVYVDDFIVSPYLLPTYSALSMKQRESVSVEVSEERTFLIAQAVGLS